MKTDLLFQSYDKKQRLEGALFKSGLIFPLKVW